MYSDLAIDSIYWRENQTKRNRWSSSSCTKPRFNSTKSALTNRRSKTRLCLHCATWARNHTRYHFRDVTITQTLSLIHISEPTRQAEISYAVFCLKKKK